jgi:hypothetical protein
MTFPKSSGGKFGFNFKKVQFQVVGGGILYKPIQPNVGFYDDMDARQNLQYICQAKPDS